MKYRFWYNQREYDLVEKEELLKLMDKYDWFLITCIL
jgi:hypothetical protein